MGNKLVCDVATHKAHVNLVVWNASNVPDPHGLLQGNGTRVRSVPFTSVKGIPRTKVTALIKAAARLDRG